MTTSERRELVRRMDIAVRELLGEIREVELAMSSNKRWLSKHYRRPFGQETEDQYWERLHRCIEEKRAIVRVLREQRAELAN